MENDIKYLANAGERAMEDKQMKTRLVSMLPRELHEYTSKNFDDFEEIEKNYLYYL